MRQTSIDAWEDIKASGVLGLEQLRAYECLFRHGPLTGREIDDRLGVDMHKRLSELERLGVVKCNGKRECRVTGRQVHEWDVTPYRATRIAKRAARTGTKNKSTTKALLELLKEACKALDESGDLFARSKAHEIRRKVGEL